VEKQREKTFPRILVVEDDIIIGAALEYTLLDAGYCVVGNVTSGEEAIRTVGSLHPDLVLMDIRLGDGLDGIDTAKALYSLKGLRCVFVSANSDAATRRRAAEANPLGWVSKLFSPDDILRAITDALLVLKSQTSAGEQSPNSSLPLIAATSKPDN
jgi:DNA-binding NarL/FixJ family response regulator